MQSTAIPGAPKVRSRSDTPLAFRTHQLAEKGLSMIILMVLDHERIEATRGPQVRPVLLEKRFRTKLGCQTAAVSRRVGSGNGSMLVLEERRC